MPERRGLARDLTVTCPEENWWVLLFAAGDGSDPRGRVGSRRLAVFESLEKLNAFRGILWDRFALKIEPTP